jgi:hypothetical protein
MVRRRLAMARGSQSTDGEPLPQQISNVADQCHPRVARPGSVGCRRHRMNRAQYSFLGLPHSVPGGQPIGRPTAYDGVPRSTTRVPQSRAACESSRRSATRPIPAGLPCSLILRAPLVDTSGCSCEFLVDRAAGLNPAARGSGQVKISCESGGTRTGTLATCFLNTVYGVNRPGPIFFEVRKARNSSGR